MASEYHHQSQMTIKITAFQFDHKILGRQQPANILNIGHMAIDTDWIVHNLGDVTKTDCPLCRTSLQ